MQYKPGSPTLYIGGGSIFQVLLDRNFSHRVSGIEASLVCLRKEKSRDSDRNAPSTRVVYEESVVVDLADSTIIGDRYAWDFELALTDEKWEKSRQELGEAYQDIISQSVDSLQEKLGARSISLSTGMPKNPSESLSSKGFHWLVRVRVVLGSFFFEETLDINMSEK